MFKTCRRHEELNKTLILKGVHFVGLHYTLVSQYTVQKIKSTATVLDVCGKKAFHTAWHLFSCHQICRSLLLEIL